MASVRPREYEASEMAAVITGNIAETGTIGMVAGYPNEGWSIFWTYMKGRFVKSWRSGDGKIGISCGHIPTAGQIRAGQEDGGTDDRQRSRNLIRIFQ